MVGGGLAGSEAAWQLAERGVDVELHEMRPHVATPAHRTDKLAELVCSNTFKSTERTNAHGLLKAEMRTLGSLILWAADQARVPGGSALAVDRELFSQAVHDRVSRHARIRLVREEVKAIPSPGIIATGPLTSDALAERIRTRLGQASLSFYDAIAPVIARDSVDDAIAYRASRYGKETMDGAGDEGAYLNCPMTRAQYEEFLDALVSADQHQPHEFDKVPYFEGCMPVEEMAARGRDTLRFGPLKPVGLRDPRTGREAFAVVQLRQEDRAGRMWNIVGFQTRLRTPEQARVFRMIPGLASAALRRAPRAQLALREIEDACARTLPGHLQERAATGLLHVVAVRSHGEHVEWRRAHFLRSTRNAAISRRSLALSPKRWSAALAFFTSSSAFATEASIPNSNG